MSGKTEDCFLESISQSIILVKKVSSTANVELLVNRKGFTRFYGHKKEEPRFEERENISRFVAL